MARMVFMAVVPVVGVVMVGPSWGAGIRTKYEYGIVQITRTPVVAAEQGEWMAETEGKPPGASGSGRGRLTRDRVLQAALTVADAGGLGALTIRSLASELGTKPMSVYYHVAGKSEILDAL